MKILLITIQIFLFSAYSYAQHNFTLYVRDASTGDPLPGASISLPDKGLKTSSDDRGYAEFKDLAAGKQPLQVSFLGYHNYLDTVEITGNTDTLRIALERAGEEMEEVVISSTRSSRTIANIPTRVEFIAGEELEEKANMKPGDIRMVLSESTGIQTQQTSATSGNTSIRIQGLDGRYTQILKDGFPLYSGAASGLGLLQTPPLDLKRIEVIKGSASTLYGGGAIAGLVNLISKEPENERELNFHFNGTSAGGLDLNGFYSERYGKLGLTVFAARNSNAAYDPAHIDLTAIPRFERYTLNPKLFFYLNDKTKLNIGINSNFENRIGGDLHYIEGERTAGHSYFERNKSGRLSSQFVLEHDLNSSNTLTIKNSVNHFNRRMSIPDYTFDGIQNGSFTELSFAHQSNTAEWITGVNVWTDDFREKGPSDGRVSRSYNQTISGAFVQNNTRIKPWMELETGVRADYVADYGVAFLPRLSVLFKINPGLSSRLGGGFGYKTPNIFTEDTERIQYRNVLPVNADKNKLEKSYGLNADLNYRTALFDDAVSFSINQLVFYTYLDNPLQLVSSEEYFSLVNSPGHIDTRGAETNIKLGFSDFKLFLGYTLTDTKLHTNGVLRQNPLTSKHRLNNVLMYELEDQWKIGAEAYYFGKQKLNDGRSGRSYWVTGFMAEKLWDKFSLYINFENFTNTRQTKFESIYTGSVTNPVFKDIYAPLDGFVVNGGIKLRL